MVPVTASYRRRNRKMRDGTLRLTMNATSFRSRAISYRARSRTWWCKRFTHSRSKLPVATGSAQERHKPTTALVVLQSCHPHQSNAALAISAPARFCAAAYHYCMTDDHYTGTAHALVREL